MPRDTNKEEIKKNLADALALHGKMYGDKGQEESGLAPIPVVGDDESGDEDTLKASDEDLQEEDGEPVEPEEAEEEPVEPDEDVLVEQGETVSAADYDRIQHSYDVLKGMHEKQVVEVAAENRHLRADLRDMTAEVERMARQVEDLQKNKAAQEVEDVAFASFASDPAIKDLADEHGDDVVKVIFKHVASAVAPVKKEVENLRGEVQENTERVQANASKTELDLFLGSLGRVVSDWEEVNESPGFKKYLSELVSGTGEIRDAFLQRHLHNRNLKGLAQIFLDYKASLDGSIGKGKVFVPQPQGEQVVPDRGRSPQKQSSSRPAEEIWDAKRIGAFYAHRMGRTPDFEGKKLSPAQLKRLEKDLVVAKKEGRYRE